MSRTPGYRCEYHEMERLGQSRCVGIATRFYIENTGNTGIWMRCDLHKMNWSLLKEIPESEVVVYEVMDL